MFTEKETRDGPSCTHPVCVHACMTVSVHACMYLCMHEWQSVCMHVSVHACMTVSARACVQTACPVVCPGHTPRLLVCVP